jgi:hypothetical protein
MATNTDIVKQNGRILYVEPNDLYGYVNGVPMTPDYSDYCISVNLIAEVVSRFKQSGDDLTKKYIISWTTRPGVDSDGNPATSNNWIAFLQGQDAQVYGGDGTLLTTYYTDINYDDVVKNNIVEGLGIESVQVSFESYYTPTIVIKFIDVRGSSLFGREEAVHESGENLTASSVFGVFFTVPYPKFKLQIKGFYGHAVTYQMTCSDFKASFNSQTGNFEAVATFIGYSYSLLTDIPLRYLVAAPYCNYVGKSYWESRLNSSDWALSDGQHPRPLFEIIKDIRSLITSDEKELVKSLMTKEEAEKKANMENERSLLNAISTCLKNYQNALKELDGVKSLFVASDNPDDNIEQLILFSDSEKIVAGDKIKNTSNALNTAFNEYNNSFTSKEFSVSLLPNCSHSFVKQAEDTYQFTEICDVTVENSNGVSKITKVSFKKGNTFVEQTVNGISKITVNDRKISNALATQLYNDSHPSSPDNVIKTYFAKYAYLIDFNRFLGVISERIENINKADTELDNEIKLRVQDAAKFTLEFTPYIGDVFKIIMCHLETFIHMMWECYHNIKKSDRSPGYLKVSLDDTDFANVGTNFEIGPWPGVFNNGRKEEDGGEIDNSLDGTIAWVGDFSHNFEEEKFVIELYKAVQKVGETEQEKQKPMTVISTLPVMPNDINNWAHVFDGSVKNNVSSLAGYLSFRAAQIFGILFKDGVSNEMASSLGKMDAYNYFTRNRSRSDIKNSLLNATSNSTLENVLYNISICSNDGDEFCQTTYHETDKRRHDFETQYCIDSSYNNRDRHPMFKENGSKLKYIHYYTSNKVGLVPDKMTSYEVYNSIFPYKGAPSNPYFEFTSKENEDTFEANDFLHKSDSKMLFNGDNSLLNIYVNNDMFDIENNVDDIKQKYDELKSGTFKIYGDEFSDDFNNVLEKLWHVTTSDYGEYFKGNSYMLSKKVKELGIEEGDLYPDNKDTEDESKAPKTLNNEKWLETGDTGITFDTTKESWVDKDGNEQPLDNLFIRYMQSYFPKGGGGYDSQCIFGDPFYYVQNNGISSSESSEVKMRRKCVKALLFLHTLNYNHKNITGFLKHDKTCGGIYVVPYGYLLLLGGLLWRQKYYDTNHKDPIQNGTEYKEVGIDNTLFAEIDGQYRMCALLKSDNGSYNVKVSTLFGGGNNWMPDHYVTNKLVSLFLEFVSGSGHWGTIMTKLELQNLDKYTSGNRNPFSYDGSSFIDEVGKFKQDLTIAIRAMDNNTTIHATDINKYLKGNVFMVYTLKLASKYFYNFFDNYKYIYVKEFYRSGGPRGLLLLMNENQTDIQDEIKRLYTEKKIIIDSSGIRHSYKGSNSIKEIEINKEIFKSYLQGFRTKLEEIVNNEITAAPQELGSTDVTLKRDVLLAMYLYLKILWDKWLVSTNTKKYKNNKTVSYEDYYNVENFYNSFIFIDAFYKNIYSKFLINCETLKNAYDGRDENGSLFQFIGDITSEHHCLFLALPDYVDMGNADNEKARDSMMNMFKPIPYNEMNSVDDENRFVIIYTPRMSEVPSTMNNYREDYIRIWNPVTNTWDENLPGVYTLEPVNNTNNAATRYGYYVPSFGVAFSRQNNHLFKNIGLNMTTPLVTSASINALANIALKGSGNQHKVAFMGQDLYPVFSNYSYICEIEMMGDAQIQPLMYFQLMNIPMWSGVYMIFNVTHTISAGNMTTKFKGMKLSRNPLPYNSSWYMFRPDGNDSGPGERSEYDVSSTSTPVTVIGGNYKKAEGDIKSHYDDKENYVTEGVWKSRNTTASGGNVSENLKSLYNRLYEEIKSYQEENWGKMTWNVGFTSIGHGGHTSKSQHYRGYAMDLRLTRFDANGKCKGVDSGQNKTADSKYFIVMDILYSLHFNEIHQNIYEVYDKGQYYDPVKQYRPKCLHVGIKEREGHNTQFYCDNGNYGNFKFDGGVLLPEFKGIASKHYRSNKSSFKSVFINFNSLSDQQIESMLGCSAVSGDKKTNPVNSTFMQWYDWSMSWEGKYGGVTKSEMEQYKRDGGSSSNPSIEDIALVTAWDANHLSNVKDPSVALVCMYTIYWTGNCALIYNALNGTSYSNTKKSPWRLKPNDIATINNRSSQELFNKIKKQAGEFILNPPSRAALPDGGDPGPGWRRRWFSINYGPSLITNEGMGNKAYSEQELRNAMANL